VRVYDASGAWGDPEFRGDVRDGLPALRREWIIARGDVEEYAGREVLPQDDGYLTEGAREFAKIKTGASSKSFPVFVVRRCARARARVTQMHYARKGIVTPEMEFVACAKIWGARWCWTRRRARRMMKHATRSLINMKVALSVR
jgi:phosphomethylpyrimidine synthase